MYMYSLVKECKQLVSSSWQDAQCCAIHIFPRFDAESSVRLTTQPTGHLMVRWPTQAQETIFMVSHLAGTTQICRLVDLDFSPKTSWTTSWDISYCVSVQPDNGSWRNGSSQPSSQRMNIAQSRSSKVGRFNYANYEWGSPSDQSCHCGDNVQTMEHGTLNELYRPMQSFRDR